MKKQEIYFNLQEIFFALKWVILVVVHVHFIVSSHNIEKVIDNHENILLIGGSGSAKTHLAIGLAFTAIERGYRVRFYTLNELASQLLDARTHNYETKFINSVKRFHLIVRNRAIII